MTILVVVVVVVSFEFVRTSPTTSETPAAYDVAVCSRAATQLQMHLSYIYCCIACRYCNRFCGALVISADK